MDFFLLSAHVHSESTVKIELFSLFLLTDFMFSAHVCSESTVQIEPTDGCPAKPANGAALTGMCGYKLSRMMCV